MTESPESRLVVINVNGPGKLIHVDVTKFGNIPDGGGWRFVGVEQGWANRQATRDRTGTRNKHF